MQDIIIAGVRSVRSRGGGKGEWFPEKNTRGGGLVKVCLQELEFTSRGTTEAQNLGSRIYQISNLSRNCFGLQLLQPGSTFCIPG